MRNILLSTVAAGAFILMAGGPAHAFNQPFFYVDGEENVDASNGSANIVQADQTLGTNITGSGVVAASGQTENDDANSTYKTGDVDYQGTTTNYAGVFTLQNQTGLNNAGNNGANIAAQINTTVPDVNVDLDGGFGFFGEGSVNAVNAIQDMTANITNSPVSVNTILTNEQRAMNRTGDVDYDVNTFNGVGLYTLQNQTGMNNAGNNGNNLAVQANLDAEESIDLDDGSTNQVVALQSMSSTIDPSNVTITNDSDVDELTFTPNRTGDVTYSQNTFAASGLYTLQNNTGLNVAANNGANLAVQLNDGASDTIELDEGSANIVLASQIMGATVADSSVIVTNIVDSTLPSRTGNVTYEANTFDAPGVFTLSNNTGMNNAASNAMNIAVQLNGI